MAQTSTLVRLALAAVMIIALADQNSARAQNARRLYARAPDVVPGTLPEMRDPGYWIARMEQPDAQILTHEEIEAMNERFREKMDDLDALEDSAAERVRRQLAFSPGLVVVAPDVGALSPGELAGLARDLVERQTQRLRRRSFGNRLGVEYSTSEIDAMVAELAQDAIGDTVEVRPGILVESALLRTVPAIRPEYVGLSQTGKTRWDLWNLDVVPIGSPVSVLHRSRTGGFLLIASPRGFGWVESEQVALGRESEIETLVGSAPFFVATGDRVPFYADADCTYVSGWLRMGDRLPQAEGGEERRIAVPVRRISGDFAIADAWLAPDADVHHGYLPYTRRHVVEQAFKLLDNVYDWTGGWFGRNHATVLRDVFATFGFELPSNGVFLAYFSDRIDTIPEELERDAKMARLRASEPFITIQTSNSGHGQLYLGSHDGQVIVFDTHGYSYENESGETLELRRCVVGTIDLPDYMLEQELTLTEMR